MCSKKKLDWSVIRKWAVQSLGGLLMEKNDDGVYVVSVGRVAWWLAFIPAVFIWVYGKGALDDGISLRDISPNHFNILIVLISYNLSKKGIDVVGKFFTKSNPKQQVQQKVDESDGPG